MQHRAVDSQGLGADLRALRRARGLTLADLAERLGRSVGWLSQVERDLSEPSITDLRHIGAVLDVPMSLLFGQAPAPAGEAGHIVRRAARRPLGSGAAGLVEELLSPDLTDDFEMVHSTFLPHSRIRNVVTRRTQEVGYLISGKLDLEISGTGHKLHPGDSFRIRGAPFRWSNPYDVKAEAIWVIAPPIY
ncbi:MAG: XRE family transcriptional regulator [Rhodobacteraceae bacterium]|nr:MAG: XRE family transcriptional regulator [Paracoccaceae bacterium]